MTRARVGLAAVRIAGVAGVLAVATLATMASHAPATAHLTSFLAKYSPARLAAGRVWTLPLSAFLLGHPHLIGPTSFMLAFVFLPYVLCCGLGRAAITAMSGHVASTLVVAAVVLPGALLGWSTAVTVTHSLDYGASAALAACGGGLAVVVGRRRPLLGAVVVLLVGGFFAWHLLSVHKLDANQADIEHLVALFTGAAVEWSFSMRRHRLPPVAGPAGSVAGPVPGLVPGPVPAASA